MVNGVQQQGCQMEDTLNNDFVHFWLFDVVLVKQRIFCRYSLNFRRLEYTVIIVHELTYFSSLSEIRHDNQIIIVIMMQTVLATFFFLGVMTASFFIVFQSYIHFLSSGCHCIFC